MSAAAEARQITGAQWEAQVTEASFAGEVAGRRALWFAGVTGLDPLHATNDLSHAAQCAAMACAAHVLGPELADNNRFRRGQSRLAREFFEWLTDHSGNVDAQLRRLALRLACDIPGLPVDKVLDGAIALHGGVT